MTAEPFQVHHPDAAIVIIIFIGGDNSLSAKIDIDLDEMRRGAGTDVAVLAVTDKKDGPAQVIEVTASGKLVLENPGEIDTGNPEILAGLLARALVSYPQARRTAIGFWSHGTGVFDETEGKPPPRAVPGARLPRWRISHSPPSYAMFGVASVIVDDQSGGILTTREAGKVLRDAFAAAGRGSVDMIFSDSCLNGMIEVATEFEEFASCMVGSEELEPADGWDYFEWLSLMQAEPPADAEAWSRQAVNAMETAYRHRTLDFPVTLSAIRAKSGIVHAFTELLAVARRFDRSGFELLDRARRGAHIFASSVDSYDLIEFARRVAAPPTIQDIAGAAGALGRAAEKAVVSWIALGDEVADAHGIAFWFPSNRESLLNEIGTYRELRFDQLTRWSSYLDAYR